MPGLSAARFAAYYLVRHHRRHFRGFGIVPFGHYFPHKHLEFRLHKMTWPRGVAGQVILKLRIL